MSRVIAVMACGFMPCGFMRAACSTTMPSLDFMKSAPQAESLAIESRFMIGPIASDAIDRPVTPIRAPYQRLSSLIRGGRSGRAGPPPGVRTGAGAIRLDRRSQRPH
jgi:hypothetical protein